MNAAEIIEEIKHLPPAEQARVYSFVRSLSSPGKWTPQELSEAAALLVTENDPHRAQELREQIAAGFYGNADA